MHVRFFGVRGSVPTPGQSTVRYGGNTVCTEVRLADGSVLILDGGTGIRELGRALMSEGHEGPLSMLLTHLHWDHIIGIPFFGPIWKRETVVRVYPLANDVQQHIVGHRVLFDGVHFPVRAEDVPARIDFVADDADVWQIGSAKVRRIALNHPGGAQGFRIDDADGRSLAYLTDNELSPPGPAKTTLKALAAFASGVDLLIHDAQYFEADMPQKRGWGHSTVDDVLVLAKETGTPHLAFFHHDPERDDDALDGLGVRANEWLDAEARGTHATVAREGWAVSLRGK